ncbi:B-cell receptor-associated protein 31-like [Limulus polyphemus]|uniref:Endoplasmic reticulum transmembrane protein n=1 Tax=Limulus polyphemus TaxID=6850 RepID=A0ABM1B997_LIMPO|nr:B-cell receptor-associated protein 31-like [Limulus polyphemus]
MSLQWTLIAGFLYAEIGFMTLLLLPLISPTRWHRIFKSKFFQAVTNQAHVYFTICIVGLVLVFLDSIREIRKHAEGRKLETEHGHLDAELQHSVRMFRAERNFYISGFSLFLFLIIRRLLILISGQALLLAQNEAFMKQATSASQHAEKLMKELEMEKKEENHGNNEEKQEVHKEEVEQLKQELQHAKEELEHTTNDLKQLKCQAESVNNEYMKLIDQYAELKAEKENETGQSGDKKEN